MSCCGRHRTEAAHLARSGIRPAPMPDPVTTGMPGAPRLRCNSARALAMRGPRSGRAYRFTDSESTAVDARDLEALLRTGLLRLDRSDTDHPTPS